MKKEKVNIDGFNLVGITVRTNNENEMNPATGKIGPTVNSYWSQQIAAEFNDRVNPGVTYIAYTDYESDEHGEYTFFIGEQVKSFADQDAKKFRQLVIPAGSYQKFTTDSGKIPDIIISSWQKIWQMTPVDFEGKRKYAADFEVYDQRAINPANAVVDIYLGIL